MIPRRGAQVANITEKDLNDVLEVRIALENVAIEKACARMSEEEMSRLWLAAKFIFSMHRFISIKTVDFIMEILQHCIQRINKENLKLLREVS